jgi:anti-sigma factor RsiW
VTENFVPGQGACSQYEALLEDYLTGELSIADAKTVDQHLQDCSPCHGALELGLGSARLLRLAGPTVEPGPGFARIVMARIRAAESERAAERAGFWQPLVSLGWGFAATATLVLVGLVTYDAGWVHRAKVDVASERVVGPSDLFGPDPGASPSNRDEVLIMVAENNHAK